MNRLTPAAAAAVLACAVAVTAPSAAAPLDPPPGSYQNTCVQIIVQPLLGGSGKTLQARCPNRHGRYVDATLALPCRGDIQNRNGALQCVRGADPFAPPPGSYQARCRDVRLAGPILSARCTTLVGAVTVETSIDTLGCRGRDIRVNALGRLAC
jgi:hypothetical protein